MSNPRTPEELQEYLAKIRKTVSESEALIQSARLRIEETDRILASQGLTREDVLAWHPTKEQRLLVNETLRAHGLPPIEEDDADLNFDAATEKIRTAAQVEADYGASSEPVRVEGTAENEDEVSERQRKFKNFMRDYRI